MPAPTVDVEVRIAAPPEVVFPYLVEAPKLVRWMGKQAVIEAVPGGRFRLDMDNDDAAVGTVTAVDPPHHLELTWGWEGNDDVPPGSTTVRFELRADGDDTVVAVHHHDLPESWRDRHHEGWTHFLPQLVELLTQGAPA